MRLFSFIVLSLTLTACNSVYMKPHTLDKDQLIFIQRGGYGMKRSIKQTMDERGYKLSTGRLKYVGEVSGKEVFEISKDSLYTVKVTERAEKLRPIWCMFNGFWWWNFNISIVDRTNNSEILSWRGRGCANSSLRKLNKILDELEMPKTEIAAPAKPTKSKKSKDNTDYETLSVLLSADNDDE